MGRSPWTTRLTVEECPVQLCSEWFRRYRIFEAKSNSLWTVGWGDGTSVQQCFQYYLGWGGLNNWSIFIRPQPSDPDEPFVDGSGQRIRLARTRPEWGGQRFWFVCECKRKCGKLYLPPGQSIFRCRICYNLAYRSSQTHDKQMDGIRPKRASRRQRPLSGDSHTTYLKGIWQRSSLGK